MIGENIRRLRKEKNMTQEQLAEIMEVSVPAVSKWETEQSAPELSALIALADHFGVSVDHLVGHRVKGKRIEDILEKLRGETEDIPDLLRRAEEALRLYPNQYEVVDACANAYYRVAVIRSDDDCMRRSLSLVERLFDLAAARPEVKREELCYRLANHHENLRNWESAQRYYEKINFNGDRDREIARCLSNRGRTQESTEILSDNLLSDMTAHVFDVMAIAGALAERGEQAAATAAIRWCLTMVEGLSEGRTQYTARLASVLYMGLFSYLEDAEEKEKALGGAAKNAAWCEKHKGEDAPYTFLRCSRKPELISGMDEGATPVLMALCEGVPAYREIIEAAMAEV